MNDVLFQINLTGGAQGQKGDTGSAGPANSLSIGTVTKGEQASATITGESPNQILNLVLPKGDQGIKGDQGQKGDKGDPGLQGLQGVEGPKGDPGVTPNIQVGTTTTLEAGSQATVTQRGTAENPIFDFGIPRGADGSGSGSGENGATYTPNVSEDGMLSWTNDKGLPNPDPVNIKGPQGDPGEDGTNGANGQGVPTGGTAGQILVKNSDADYDTMWKNFGGITPLIGTQETPVDFNYLITPGIYQVQGYVKNFPVSVEQTSDDVIKTTTPFDLGSGMVTAIIQGANNRRNGLYFVEYNTIIQLLTVFGNLQTDSQGLSYIDTDYQHVSLRMTANQSTLTGSGSLATTATVRNMILTATGISNTNPLSNLQTIDKSSLVAAINEVLSSASAANKIPTGGTAGQILSKNSATDYDMVWTDLTIGDNEPIGSIKLYGGATAPNGYLFAQGQEVSRTTYSELFSIYGTAFGEGDGSTTFNLPNLKGKVIVGLDETDTDFNSLGKTGGNKTHTQTVNELASHTHHLKDGVVSQVDGGSIEGLGGGTLWGSGVDLNTEMNSAGNAQPMNIMNPYMVFNYIIKTHKTSTAPENSEVKTVETDSTSDVYCCNYINNKLNTKTVLWENPNPTSDFDSQNIVFNNNDFDVYEVYYYIATTNQQVLTAKSLKGHGTRLIIPTDQMQYRVLTYVEGNTYSINVASDPSYAVPIKIIGYKDSLFK